MPRNFILQQISHVINGEKRETSITCYEFILVQIYREIARRCIYIIAKHHARRV